MIDTAVKQLRKIQGNDGKFPRKSSATAIVGALSTDENERPQFKITKGNQLYCAIP